MYLGNISKKFEADNMKETELNGNVFDFSADYEIIDADDILVIYTYLMKKNTTKQYFDLLKKYLLDY